MSQLLTLPGSRIHAEVKILLRLQGWCYARDSSSLAVGSPAGVHEPNDDARAVAPLHVSAVPGRDPGLEVRWIAGGRWTVDGGRWCCGCDAREDHVVRCTARRLSVMVESFSQYEIVIIIMVIVPVLIYYYFN